MTETCFFERDPGVPLLRRAMVEGVGTLLLMVAASGAGLMTLHAGRVAALLAGATATAGALVGLIVALGAASGGHFNPLISLLQLLGRERTFRCTLAYVFAQCTGALLGALLTRTIFTDGARAPSGEPIDDLLIASEVLAATGLLLVVFGCAQSKRADIGPFAVGAWLMAAIVATPSTSYANPAITLASVFATGPIGLSSGTALAYAVAEALGALLAFAIIAVAYPRIRGTTPPAADPPP